MPPVKIELSKKKNPEEPARWPHKLLAQIRDAGDSKHNLRKLLDSRWKLIKPAWEAGALLVLFVDEAVVRYEIVAPPRNKKAKEAIDKLTTPVKSTAASSGHEEEISEKQLIEDAKQLAKAPVEDAAPKIDLNKPWVVLEHDDLLKLLKYDDQAHAFKVEGRPRISVEITDPKVLKRLNEARDIPYVQQQVRDAADFSVLVTNLDKVLKDLDDAVTKDPTMMKKANAVFQLQLNEQVAKAAARAISQVAHFKQVRTDYRKYRVKAGLKLTATVASIGASIASLAAAGFTGGVSGILGIIGLARSVVAAGEQIAKLAMEAETVAKHLAKDILSIEEDFKKSVNRTGAKHVAKETFAAVTGLPASLFTTTKQAREKLGLLNDKTNGIEVNAQDASRVVNHMLAETRKLERAFGEWLSKQKVAQFDAKQRKAVRDFIAGIRSLSARTQAAIDDTITYAERTKRMRAAYGEMHGIFKQIDEKEPNLVKILQVALPALVNLGLAIASAETTSLLESWKKAHEIAGNTVGLFGNVLDSAVTLKDTYDSMGEAFSA